MDNNSDIFEIIFELIGDFDNYSDISIEIISELIGGIGNILKFDFPIFK